jgi:hypothetical protein
MSTAIGRPLIYARLTDIGDIATLTPWGARVGIGIRNQHRQRIDPMLVDGSEKAA